MAPHLSHTPSPAAAPQDPTYLRGLAALRQLEGTERPTLLDGLADLAPDLATLAIRFVYGEIYPRPGLDLRSRQLVTVAALAALGHARPQLKFHIAGALNAGCSSNEIVETLQHLVIYAGFPVGLNGVFAAREVFQERGCNHEPLACGAAQGDDSRARFQAGLQALQEIDGHAGEQVIAALDGLAPDLARFIIEFAFGDIYTRPGLSLVQRELVTLAALAALGTAVPQFKVHVHGLLNVGGTRQMLVESLIHLAAYAGFPAALNALQAAREVLDERAAKGQSC
ncbi:carboxymuconolactone decarboxylase family protein [Azohydromonas australica]|uniref:carboxymuconolactone decarboxylase family protein n=1 Tax=Azohydromonas australica TaxID=364039 RepID=UPI000408B05A|nr:carboxymuconolactone decarboxylase family protein [Azohydromonas australica]